MTDRMPEMRLDPPETPDIPDRFIVEARDQLGDQFIDERFPNLNGCVTRLQEGMMRDWLDDHEDEVLILAAELWAEDTQAKKEADADRAYERHREMLRIEEGT